MRVVLSSLGVTCRTYEVTTTTSVDWQASLKTVGKGLLLQPALKKGAHAQNPDLPGFDLVDVLAGRAAATREDSRAIAEGVGVDQLDGLFASVFWRGVGFSVLWRFRHVLCVYLSSVCVHVLLGLRLPCAVINRFVACRLPCVSCASKFLPWDHLYT